MKKEVNAWKAYLKLSQKEAVGTLLLGLVLLGLTAFLAISDYLFRGEPVRITPEDSVKLVRWLKDTPANSFPSYSSSSRFSAKATPAYQGPPIDPQRASVDELQAVGFPNYLAERMIKYRSKGGQFRQETDLSKLYGMKPEILDQVLPHLRFEKKSLAREERSFPSSLPPSRPKQKQPVRFDVNTADTTVWKSLPGIGSGYAKRICNFRDKLGGFLQVEQVMETYQLPPELGQVIRQYGFVGTPAQKIYINRVTELKHPYLPYAQAKAILAYRAQHGKFESLEDLQAIKRLTPEVLAKIAPYMSFEP